MKQSEIVRQHDLKDCGVCALLSIIKHYGGFVSLEKLRIDTHTSLEGTTAYHLIEAAKRYGFDSYGMQLNDVLELKSVIFPVIAHVEINHLKHFVVIYKMEKNKIVIMDPAKGKVKLSIKDFSEIWTKNIILFYPKYSLPKLKSESFFKTLFVQMLKTEKTNIWYIVFLTLLFTVITIFTSFYFKIGVDLLNQSSIHKALIYISFLFFFLLFIKIAIYHLKNYFKTILNKNVDGYLYHSFIHRLFLLPNYFIKNRTTGEIMLRLTELSNFKLFFSEIITTICIDSILSLGVGIILFSINTKLFFLLCFFGFMYLGYGMISGKLLYKKALDVNELEVNFQSQVVENLDTMITLKNLNVLKNATSKLEVKLIKFLKKYFKFNRFVVNTNTFSYLLEEALNFLVIFIGLWEIYHARLSLVNLITFETLLAYFLEPFKQIVLLIPDYNCMKVNLDKTNEFFAMELEDTKVGLQEFQTGLIEIKNLSFSYNKYKPILKDFSLEIEENSWVLFKGKSGCGKSTLCQMISRLLDTENQDIRVGGVNINDYSLHTIYKNITYVGQKENLIQETIQNNIKLYRDVEENRFKEVIDICNIEDIVAKKPLRYETFLLKDSLNLSGGEKQRIILARALLNDCKILILDEALSEVNEDLEIQIIKRLRTYCHGKTIIYVSHKNHDKYFDKTIDFGVAP